MFVRTSGIANFAVVPPTISSTTQADSPLTPSACPSERLVEPQEYGRPRRRVRGLGWGCCWMDALGLLRGVGRVRRGLALCRPGGPKQVPGAIESHQTSPHHIDDSLPSHPSPTSPDPITLPNTHKNALHQAKSQWTDQQAVGVEHQRSTQDGRNKIPRRFPSRPHPFRAFLRTAKNAKSTEGLPRPSRPQDGCTGRYYKRVSLEGPLFLSIISKNFQNRPHDAHLYAAVG